MFYKIDVMRLLIVILTAGFFLMSCNTLDVFEKSTNFSAHEWKASDKPLFDFKITDTTALYDIYFVIRHEDAYHYKNIWLNIAVKDPDSAYIIKREFVLADNTKWLGTGMDDIFEQRLLFNASPIHLKKGNYHFSLQQVMREDPLLSILSAGVRVEKVK
jgi:gliding motility-associated lipoprotein GldH